MKNMKLFAFKTTLSYPFWKKKITQSSFFKISLSHRITTQKTFAVSLFLFKKKQDYVV